MADHNPITSNDDLASFLHALTSRPVEWCDMVLDTARAVYRENLRRDPDPSGYGSIVNLALQGGDVEAMRAWIRESDEYKALQATPAPEPEPGPEDPPPVPSPDLPLGVAGKRFVVGAEPFVWRFATSFRLVHMMATGEHDEARAVVQELRALGFNGVRVLTTAEHLFHLRREDGVEALPATLTLLREHDLRAEVVALADTATWAEQTLVDHVVAVGRVLENHPNAVLQIANEHYHQTQHERLHDPNWVQSLAQYAPLGVLFTTSPAATDEDPGNPRGAYVTRHLDRGRDKWNMVRRLRELELLKHEIGVPVVNDEMIGAAEVAIRGRRENDPAIFYMAGVLQRVFGLGGTFHFEDGLWSRLMGPTQKLCADAFVEGTRMVPDDVELVFKNATWPDSPVKNADFNAVVRAYSGLLDERTGVLALLGLSGDPKLEMQGNWNLHRALVEHPEFRLYELRR